MYPERSQLIDGSGKPKILLVNERETWWEFACLKKIAATGSSCILIIISFFFAATTNRVGRAY